MADEDVAAQPVELTTGAVQEASNDSPPVPGVSEGEEMGLGKREQPEEPSQSSAKEEVAKRTSSAGSSRGSAMEKDDSVVTGAGSAEDPSESNVGTEVLEGSVPPDVGTAADLTADEASADKVEEGVTPDSAEEPGDARQGSNEEETSTALVSSTPAEKKSGESTAEPEGSRLSEQNMGSRGSSPAVEEKAGQAEGDIGVLQELNDLLGNSDAANQQVVSSGEGVEEQGGGEIEGFHDDFLVAQAPPPPEGLTEAEPEPSAQEAEEDQTAPQLQEAQEEHGRLLAENKQLQKRCAAIMAGKKGDSMGASFDDEMRYFTSLDQWFSQGEELRRISGHFDAVIERSKDELQARQDSAVQIRSAYLQLEMEVAREAENSRTGRPLPVKTLKQLEETGRTKDEELETVRLKSIILKNTLSRLERTLKRKEELADGLHQVDFEQLKIENQSLSEKIKVRDEDLARLRKKVNTTVHILTHQKEKLQHIHRDAEAEGLRLEAIEKEVGEKREKLQRMKRQRDAVKLENKTLKLTSGLVTQPELLHDMATQRELADTLKEKVHGMQHRHATLTASLSRASGQSGRSTGMGVNETNSLKTPTVKSAPSTARLAGRLVSTPKEANGSSSTGREQSSVKMGTENMLPNLMNSRSMKAIRSP